MTIQNLTYLLTAFVYLEIKARSQLKQSLCSCPDRTVRTYVCGAEGTGPLMHAF